MARRLPVEVSQANRDAIATGSRAHLQNVWDSLQSQLREGERLMGTWRTAQSGNDRGSVIRSKAELSWVLDGVRRQHCYSLRFFALRSDEPDPSNCSFS